jgi:hypothetical protein
MVNGTAQWAYGFAVADAQKSMSTSGSKTDWAIAIMDLSVTRSASCKLRYSAFLNGQFKLETVDDCDASMRIGYIVLGGSDITNVDAGVIKDGATLGNVNYDQTWAAREGCDRNASDPTFFCAPDFRPDFLLLAAGESDSSPPDTEVNASLFIGATDGTNQAVISGADDHGDSSGDCKRTSNSSEIVVGFSSGVNSSPIDRASFSAFLADGFRLNWAEHGQVDSRNIFWLAIEGGSYKVGGFDTSDQAGDLPHVDVDFQPRGMFFWSHNTTTQAIDASAKDFEVSLGAYEPSENNRFSSWVLAEDDSITANGQTRASSAVDFDKICINGSNSNNTTAVVDALVDIVSIDGSGFTPTMTDPEPMGASSRIWYLAFGANDPTP